MSISQQLLVCVLMVDLGSDIVRAAQTALDGRSDVQVEVGEDVAEDDDEQDGRERTASRACRARDGATTPE